MEKVKIQCPACKDAFLVNNSDLDITENFNDLFTCSLCEATKPFYLFKIYEPSEKVIKEDSVKLSCPKKTCNYTKEIPIRDYTNPETKKIFCNFCLVSSDIELWKVIGQGERTRPNAKQIRRDNMHCHEKVMQIVDENNYIPNFFFKDSGNRKTFSSGAKRDRPGGKGRYDLISAGAIRRIAKVYEEGSKKYSDRNWEKGMPVSEFIDSSLRHIFQYLDCKKDEDHLAMATWNLMSILHMEEGNYPNKLFNLPYYGQDENNMKDPETGEDISKKYTSPLKAKKEKSKND